MATPTSSTPTADGGTVPEITFGDRLRIARRSIGINQAQMAESLGISTQRLGNWESGNNGPRDSVAVAMQIQDAFGISASWLLGLQNLKILTAAGEAMNGGQLTLDLGWN